MGQIPQTTMEVEELLLRLEDEGGITATLDIYGTDVDGINTVLYQLQFVDGRLTVFP